MDIASSRVTNGTDRNSATRSMARCVGLCLMGIAAVFGGCEKPVFTPEEPRSQYDRFDAIRDQRAPSYVYDEFGSRRPNIRQRLLTTD